MQTDSEALLEAGVALAKECWAAFCQEMAWNAANVDRVVCHQVGRQHQRALLEALALDEDKDVSTYMTYGNAGSVSCPMTLARGLESGAIQRGERVALLGIGSGLCSLMQAIQC
ncbi:MAG: 3-oxoacyl-[acyl-carrier-protein] synthase III C-terminal domain-containing protein [Verrucomicrobiota bacterium]